jgi:hypothetical protein
LGSAPHSTNTLHTPLGVSEQLTAAQLNEISQREGVSVVVAYVAILTIAWVHWGPIPQTNVIGWTIFMSFTLLARVGVSRTNPADSDSATQLMHNRNLRIFVAMAYGVGWGSMLFLLDSSKLDFLFMFKLAALAAVMGVTVNSLSILLPVYIGFAIPMFLALIAFLMSNPPYLDANARYSLLIRIAVYSTLLLVAARKSSNLTRLALEQRFERETATLKAREAEEELRISQTQLRLLLNSTSEGIYGADTKPEFDSDWAHNLRSPT